MNMNMELHKLLYTKYKLSLKILQNKQTSIIYTLKKKTIFSVELKENYGVFYEMMNYRICDTYTYKYQCIIWHQCTIAFRYKYGMHIHLSAYHNSQLGQDSNLPFR